MAKRLRILAGPNGSGKSSVYAALKNNGQLNWGVFVNADEIEKQLRERKALDITTYGLSEFNWNGFSSEYVQFAAEKNAKCGLEYLQYIDHSIKVLDGEKVDSYLACFVADFIRRGLLEIKKDVTFTVETVMSHPSKLEFMRKAKEKGFRIYLYYVSTSSPEINVGRVAARVLKGGHNVPEEKIRSRYSKSLQQLHDAILLSDRAYIFDNSGSSHKWIAEYDGATGQITYRVNEVPLWVINSIKVAL